MIVYQKENSSKAYNYDVRTYQNFSFYAHLHRDFELVCVEEGEVTVTVEGRSRTIATGELALILPDQIHAYETAERSKAVVVVFAAAYVPLFCHALGRSTCEDNVFSVPKEDRDFLVRKLCEPLTDFVSRAAVLNLAVSHFLKNATLVPASAEEGRGLLLHKMLQYISEHYREHISLEGMAEQLGYESHYLSRCFHAMLGKNFKQFVNEYRVEYAKQLICARGTEMTMTEIAFDAGFSSVRNFNRAYKTIEGVEPRQHLS